jgi:hypothetical protein
MFLRLSKLMCDHVFLVVHEIKERCVKVTNPMPVVVLDVELFQDLTVLLDCPLRLLTFGERVRDINTQHVWHTSLKECSCYETTGVFNNENSAVSIDVRIVQQEAE